MPRTTWADLLDEPTPTRAPALPRAGGERAAAREATAAIPQSLDDVPELRELLAERRRLEETLAQFTGSGARPGADDRDTRRFPVEAPATPQSRLALRRADRMEELAREEDRRAFQVESLERRRGGEREERRRATAAERAARRRTAEDERVRRAADARERHHEQQLAARDRLRDLARDAARMGDGLELPGGDTLRRLSRAAEAAGELFDPDARRSRPADRWSQLRDAARRAEDSLAETGPGRRLRALRDELLPPEVRPLPDHTHEGDVDALERRRARALAALRERRAEDAPRPRRATAEAGA